MNLRRLPTLTALCMSLASKVFAIAPVALHCENRLDPLGIDVPKPRLSWILDCGHQTAYQIVVEGAWDSGRVTSDQSVAVEYAGHPLKSQTRYDWRVRVWDNSGVAGEWSPQGKFVTGVLGESWQGKWIASGDSSATTSKGIGYHAG